MTAALAVAVAPLAAAASFALTPLARVVASRLGATDVPDARRVHRLPTPRGGALAIVPAAAFALGVVGAGTGGLGAGTLAGAALLVAVGVVDDVVSLRPLVKLAAQVLAAVAAVAVDGLRVPLFDLAATGTLARALDAGLAVAWIVLVTNALNLTDGLDGLAAGIGVIGLTWIAAAAARAGDVTAALPALALAGALAGFLPYNFNGASIFLGDAGSLLVGYALAVLPLGAAMPGTAVPPIAAFLVVAVPLTDTLLAIGRRFCAHCLPLWGDGRFLPGVRAGLANVVRPDRRHIHHRLLDLGFSPRRTVLTLHGASAVTSGLAYTVSGPGGWPLDLVALGIAGTVVALIQLLGIDELRPARSGLLVPVVRRLARRRWVAPLADAIVVAAAYAAAAALAGRASAVTAGALVAVTAVELLVFAAAGVYRTAWVVAGVSGLGLLLRAGVVGTTGAYAALRVLGLPASGTVTVVHGLGVLATLIVVRFSYVLLVQAARAGREPTLICGTEAEGHHALLRLRQEGVALAPIGWVEVRPRWQGRRLGALPVLGTLEQLPAIVAAAGVRHLVLADPAVRGAGLDWVRAVCRAHGVHVHRYVERLVTDDPLADRRTRVRRRGAPRALTHHPDATPPAPAAAGGAT